MVGWHHRHNGHVFGWTLGVGDGQGGLACCGSWGRKESDTTEQLNWTELSRVPCAIQQFFSLCFMYAKSLQLCPTLCKPWIVARQAPLPVGLSRQEYWTGLPFPTPSVLCIVVCICQCHICIPLPCFPW